MEAWQAEAILYKRLSKVIVIIKSKDKWMSSFFEKACTCHKMVKEMHLPYEAFLGGATCVP